MNKWRIGLTRLLVIPAGGVFLWYIVTVDANEARYHDGNARYANGYPYAHLISSAMLKDIMESSVASQTEYNHYCNGDTDNVRLTSNLTYEPEPFCFRYFL